jgi:hypothetical protein
VLTALLASLAPLAPLALAQTAATSAHQGPKVVDRFHLIAGDTYWLEEDFELEARREVIVEGRLLGALRADSGDSKGVSIKITSNEAIIIRGDIIAGMGAAAYSGMTDRTTCVLKGGAGGDVVLSAPLILVDGRIMAGAGGVSGPNAEAPAGGVVRTQGTVLTTREDPRKSNESPWAYRDRLGRPGGFGLFGGAGGSHRESTGHGGAGVPAGIGGRGGAVRCVDFPVIPKVGGSYQAIALLQSYGPRGPAQGIRESFQTTGERRPASHGARSVPGFGGDGTRGAGGAKGTRRSPQGQTGAPGGHAGLVSSVAAAPSGLDAIDGDGPSIEPGGKGGRGKRGQDMTGGRGGAGGHGGDGLWDEVTQGYLAPGGDGGDGGEGGAATGGTGGQGGRGGRPGGPGGEGGAGGRASAGPGGEGGRPGKGSPLASGKPGRDGRRPDSEADGNPGGPGATGGQGGTG